MKNMKSQFNLLLFIIFLLATSLAIGQVSDTKTLKAEFTGKQAVSLVHSHGPVLVQKSTDNKTYVTAIMTATAKDQESLNLVFDHFNIKENEIGNKVDLQTKFDVESWNTNNNSSTIIFKDGEKVKGIKDLKISVTLLVPSLEELKLDNKYGDIQLETGNAKNISVQLFSGELNAKENVQKLDLQLKYSKAFMKNAAETNMVLFDSDVEMGNVGGTEVSSKYSSLELGDVAGNLVITAFDDKWEVGNVNGNLDISDKYSEFEFGMFREAKAMFFDASFTAVSGYKLHMADSKYSKYKIGEIKRMEFDLSFDDKVEIGDVGTLLCANTKYTEYIIDELKENFQLSKSFDDNVRIGLVSAKFKNIFLDGKYTKMDLRMDEAAEFEVYVNMQYGKFDHPQFDIKTQKEENSRTEITGYVGAETVNGSSLRISGFDNTVYWR